MKKTKVLSILLSLIMAFGVFGTAFSASADYVTVNLYEDQYSAHSTEIFGTYKCYWGKNEGWSEHSVYFIPKYKSGAIFVTDSGRSYLMIAGKSLSQSQEIQTTHFSSNKEWRLYLNPEEGHVKNCRAVGYFRNK